MFSAHILLSFVNDVGS